MTPVTRKEKYLSAIAGEGTQIPETPITREEQYLAKIAENGGCECEQSDWEETDSSKPSYIKNKPTIPEVDDEMSSASENPVQNKVVKAAIEAARVTVVNHGIVL